MSTEPRSVLHVAYLLPVRSQARYLKRIRGLLAAGTTGEALYFNRDYYEGDALPIPAQCLGHVRNERYLQRAMSLIGAVNRVRRAARNAQIVYAFSLDLALVSCLALWGRTKVPLVYEVGDVGVFNDRGALSLFARMVERAVLRRAALLVTVTDGLADGYYAAKQGVDRGRILVIENKPERSLAAATVRQRIPGDDPVLVIGYFGVIRDQASWDLIRTIALRGDGKVRFILRGVIRGIEGWESDLEATPYIEFGGPYVSPQDLADMYGAVDMSWVAYSSGRAQREWARANRFFEACQFARPMIADARTADGAEVRRLDLGLTVDLCTPDATADAILGVNGDDLARWHGHLLELDSSAYELQDEHVELLARVSGSY